MPRFRLFPSGAAAAALASSAILVDVVRGSSSSVNDTASAGTTSTPECVAVSTTSKCSPWTDGFYVNLTAATAYYSSASPLKSAADWETALSLSSPASDLGCTTSYSVQFWTTFLCLRDLFVLSSECNDAHNVSVPELPLCVDTPDAFSSSVLALVAACPNATSSAVSALTADSDYFTAYVQNWNSMSTSSNGSCTESVTVDERSCGFGGNESAQLAYCSSSAIIFSADCCANVSSTTTKSKARTTAAFAAIQFDNVAGTTASSVASTTNGIGGLSAVAIVGIVIGCVVFVALVAVAWILFSNRKNVMRKTQILESPFVSPRNFSPTTNKNGYYVVPDTIELQQAGQRSPQASASPVRKEVVSLEYTSKFPDELSVKVGDTIEILEVFSDGWAKGKLQTAAGGFVEGMFPMACVDKSLQKDLM
ncbi:hypothetical protein HDU82_005679 [Entophlyctis luteolus]|nr:hypothetical protein HDU82_005679 [Entophlyctis luteolus]